MHARIRRLIWTSPMIKVSTRSAPTNFGGLFRSSEVELEKNNVKFGIYALKCIYFTQLVFWLRIPFNDLSKELNYWAIGTRYFDKMGLLRTSIEDKKGQTLSRLGAREPTICKAPSCSRGSWEVLSTCTMNSSVFGSCPCRLTAAVNSAAADDDGFIKSSNMSEILHFKRLLRIENTQNLR